ncbi:MAG: TonB-dependent receptor [Flavobacteriaceae bacterium]|nr:TonB-dependent receptor [Flavobacteriaceae bacterium]
MKHFINLLILFISLSSFAQHKISGYITDQKTFEPLTGVNIYIESLDTGTTTNSNGYFNLENLSAGNYKLYISYLGYQNIHENIELNSDLNTNFQLHSTVLELEGVLISTPFHKLQKDNVMKVEKIKVADLTDANNLSEQLSQVPGVNQISTGSGIGKPVIRGLSSNRVLVYAQGIRLENQQFGEEHGIGVSASGIESVEIIKGPASLLYGSDAIGGVLFLNPELYAPLDSLNIDVSSKYYSNTNGITTNFGLKKTTEKLKLLTRFSLQQHADYQFDNTRVTNSRFSEYDLKTGIGFGNDKITNDIRYNINFSRLGIPEGIDTQNNNIKPLLPNQSIENHIISSHTKVNLNKGKLDMTFGYIFNKRKEYEEEHNHDEHEEDGYSDEEINPALEMHLSTLNYNIKYELPKTKGFEIILGTQGMHQKNKNLGFETLIPDANTTDIGIFGTSHYHWKKHAIQFGLRYDYRNINVIPINTNKEFNSVNGAVGFKTDFNSKITGRINIASGFRAPNLAELTSDGEHEGSNRYETGDLNLINEQNIQLDLNLNYKSEHFDFFVNGFYNNIKDYIYLTPTAYYIDNAQVFNYLQENATLYGGELGIHLHPHPLDWLHINSSFETVTGKLQNDTYLPLIPANSIHTNLTFTITENSKLNTNAFISLKNVFKQQNVSSSETSSKNYDLVNLGVNSELQTKKANYKFNLGVNNLLDKQYINHLSRLKNNSIYNQGRNIILGLTIKL